MREPVRDEKKFIVGYIEQITATQWVAVDPGNIRIAKYDKDTNMTTDLNGVRIAFGNVLISTLFNRKKP